MKAHSINIKSFVMIAALTLPALSGQAIAQPFPCDQLRTCNQPTLSLPNKTESSVAKPKLSLEKSTLLEQISLTDEQRTVISEVVQSQLPLIREKMQALENAHAMLREMAVSRRYNQDTAVILSQTIADNSAALALLQAEREYQVYALLTPQQTRLFDQLKGKNTTQQ